MGFFRLIDGSPRESMEIIRRLYDKFHDPYSGFVIATLCDDLGDTAGRDRMLKEIAGLSKTKEEKLDGLVSAISRGLSAEGGRIDTKAMFDSLNDEVPERHRYEIAIFAARILYSHGDPEKAKDILRKCSALLGKNGWRSALATVWLREWEGR